MVRKMREIASQAPLSNYIAEEHEPGPVVQNDTEILDWIRENGCFSIFWITENRLRACVAQQMQESGEIITDNKTKGFPWILAKENISPNPALSPNDENT